MAAINIVTEPSVYLVGHQQVNVPSLDRFLYDQGVPEFQSDAKEAGEELVEIAGRLCYESFRNPRPGGNKKYIEHIIEVGHGSVLENEIFNFIITGVSRSLTHELVRHRAGFAYSQLSQRYVDESDVAFVVPPALLGAVTAARLFIERFGEPYPNAATDAIEFLVRHDSDGEYVNADDATAAGLFWMGSAERALKDYVDLSNYLSLFGGFTGDKTTIRKKAREAARSVLPNCTETKIFVTANARALRHFLELRGSEHADAEIRRLALAMLAVLAVASPHIFGDYSIVQVDGVDTIHTDHRKV